MPFDHVGVAKRLVAMALTLAAPMVSAADVNMVTSGSSRFLDIRGVIETGDYRKVVDLIADDGNHEAAFLLRSRGIFVESPGGSVDEAMKLSRLFRDIYAKITVVRQCSSACVLLYAGAVDRTPLGEIGLHNPYIDASSANRLAIKPLESELRKAEIATRDLLREFSMPTYLIEKMLSRTSVEVYKLTGEDVLAIGLHSVGWSQVRVSKCGARPDLERQYWEGELQRSPQLKSEYTQYSNRVRACENTVLGPVVVKAALLHIDRELGPPKR
jgi:hypothetical protein